MKRMLLAVAILLCGATGVQAKVLRVCAAPHNLPFSNDKEQGFENRIVTLIARDLGDTIRYVWWTQHEGFSPASVLSESCDLWLGAVKGSPGLATTRPYYRSTYVFVSRTDRGLHISSLNDPALHHLAIGVQLLGYEAWSTPPEEALRRRGIVHNVHGFAVLGSYGHPNPPTAVLRAVEHGEVDIAAVWGPLAAFYAARHPGTLTLTPITPQLADGLWPMAYAISMAVPQGDTRLLAILNRVLLRDRAAIDAILRRYHLPLPPAPGSA